MTSIEAYRASDNEQQRTRDLLRLLPKGRRSVLDIGARDGHFSRLLTQYFEHVTALDLLKPPFAADRITTVAGDVTQLQFPDNSFDCVFCAEVLEHIPLLEQACREIVRVARHEIIIGVPFRQEIRSGRMLCRSCGRVNPPWGHVNTFDEPRLIRLFQGVKLAEKSFVGTERHITNPLSMKLMDLAGHPWGTYMQEEPCIHCGARLKAPGQITFFQSICAHLAIRLEHLQSSLNPPHGNWIHLRFAKS